MKVTNLPFKKEASSSFFIAKAYSIELSTDAVPLSDERRSGYMIYRDSDGIDSYLAFRLGYTGMSAELHKCMDLLKLTKLVIDYTNVAIAELAISEGINESLNIVIHSIVGSVNPMLVTIKYH